MAVIEQWQLLRVATAWTGTAVQHVVIEFMFVKQNTPSYFRNGFTATKCTHFNVNKMTDRHVNYTLYYCPQRQTASINTSRQPKNEPGLVCLFVALFICNYFCIRLVLE